MQVLFVTLYLLVSCVLALPHASKSSPFGISARGYYDPAALHASEPPSTPKFDILKYTGCPQPSKDIIPIPINQTAIAVPDDVSVIKYTMLGRGVQNYTCTNGSWVSAGALANLYDVSCLADLGILLELPSLALSGLSYPSSTPDIPIAMHHFFAATPFGGTGISPVFAFNSDNGPAPFGVYVRQGSTPSPDEPGENVAWLQLFTLEDGPAGGVSNWAYRVVTAGGQPATTCGADGDTGSVDYATLYIFAD